MSTTTTHTALINGIGWAGTKTPAKGWAYLAGRAREMGETPADVAAIRAGVDGVFTATSGTTYEVR